MLNFHGSWFLALGFPRDLTQFCGISWGAALLCLQFPEVKLKKEKFQGGFKKIMSSTPPVWFFLEKPIECLD